jgi:ATP-dependent Lhr-like helicase
VEAIRSLDPAELRPAVDEVAVDGLKFSQCLPPEFAIEMLEARMLDLEGSRAMLAEQVRFIVN